MWLIEFLIGLAERPLYRSWWGWALSIATALLAAVALVALFG